MPESASPKCATDARAEFGRKLLLVAIAAAVIAGCGSDAPPAESPLSESEVAPATTADDVALRVAVTDETTAGLPDLEVWVRGTGSWYPDVSSGGDVLHEAGPFSTDGTDQLVIYPDGRDGREVAVDIEPPDDAIAGSVRDMIQITVDDSRVNVFATSIDGFEIEQPR